MSGETPFFESRSANSFLSEPNLDSPGLEPFGKAQFKFGEMNLGEYWMVFDVPSTNERPARELLCWRFSAFCLAFNSAESALSMSAWP